MSEQDVQMIEKDGAPGLFRRLADVLDVSMDDLVGWREERGKCQP